VNRNIALKIARQYIFLCSKSDHDNSLERKLDSMKSQFAGAAQKVYDEWEQDEKGEDPELGPGGICQNIADEISDILAHQGIDAIIADTEGMVDQHVWVIAYDPDKKIAFNIDIDPHIYESGHGYTWKKKPDIKFQSSHIDISPAEYETVEYYLNN
jgi:hypothetical protein